MKHPIRSGFSLLEIVAAVVILAVVTAATVATVAPIRGKSRSTLADREIAILNVMSQAYLDAHGRHPRGVDELAAAGYLPGSGPAAQDRVPRIKSNYDYDPHTGIFSR